MNEHVQSTISASASLLYALRVLRAHGMPETALQVVYQATVMAKVLYAASAWWGFTSASDKQRIKAFVGRAKRCGLCYADHPPVSSLVEDADDKLFEYVLTNPDHSLNELLPDRRHELTHSLRPRRHDLTLSRGSHRLSDCNFIVRILFKDSYWSLVTTTCNIILVELRPDSFFNKIILYFIVFWPLGVWQPCRSR